MVWLAYKEEPGRWVAMKAEDFSEMVAMNQRGEEPTSLEEKEIQLVVQSTEPALIQPEEGSLTRFDRPKGELGGKNRKSGGRNRSRSGNQNNRQRPAQNSSNTHGSAS
jgi:hypothetical protein